MMIETDKDTFINQSMAEESIEWAIMHGVAFRQADNTARHCPFSIAPITMQRKDFEHILKVTPLLSKLISAVCEDHDFLQSALTDMANADPFFGRLMSLHRTLHGTKENRFKPLRQPLLLMRTDYMDDRIHGAKVVEFNGIAAGMAPFGQRATQLHKFIHDQWPHAYESWLENIASKPVENAGLEQLAFGIALSANKIKKHFKDAGKPTFLMVVQKDEDNVYDQHLLEVELQKRGLRTVRRTFEQLATQLSTGENNRLLLDGVGSVDTVYLRAGYQYSDYWAPELNETTCCHTLSETRLFIERHHVAVNATISQQLATSKSMQMILTMMPEQEYARWGLSSKESRLIKSVLADMKPVNVNTIEQFNASSSKSKKEKQEWVLKNQGEGGGHCVFGEDINETLSKLSSQEYDAWALMQRLYPHEREKPTIAIRDGQQSLIKDLVSEIGLFTVYFNGEPVTEYDGYAGYLIRSKPASENEGGIHSGKGILDSLSLVE